MQMFATIFFLKKLNFLYLIYNQYFGSRKKIKKIYILFFLMKNSEKKAFFRYLKYLFGNKFLIILCYYRKTKFLPKYFFLTSSFSDSSKAVPAFKISPS